MSRSPDDLTRAALLIAAAGAAIAVIIAGISHSPTRTDIITVRAKGRVCVPLPSAPPNIAEVEPYTFRNAG
ncbi:hypothetical protein ABZ897_50740 [Nonomuraea sp. NPDC046802]|uniref:hypothetical protein n=1 Tax=Nonomuraea sp. NPDC046802 TaxID=3154919 RepID=UPI003401431E